MFSSPSSSLASLLSLPCLYHRVSQLRVTPLRMWLNPSFWCNLSEHQTHAVQNLGHISYQDIQKVSQRPMGMLICNPCRKSRGALPSTPERSFLSCVSSSPAHPAGRGLCLTASTLELSVGGGWTRKVKRNMKNAPSPCSRGIERRVSRPGA